MNCYSAKTKAPSNYKCKYLLNTCMPNQHTLFLNQLLKHFEPIVPNLEFVIRLKYQSKANIVTKLYKTLWLDTKKNRVSSH